MKKVLISMFILVSCLVILIGCSKEKKAVNPPETKTSKISKSTSQDSSDSKHAVQSETNKVDKGSKEEKNSNENAVQEQWGNKETAQSMLTGYSEEQVKNARVWLTVNGKKDITELYVSQLPAGTPIVNTIYGDGSVSFPIEVTVLSSEIVANGSVWYSDNSDGSVIVYPVPSHWGSDIQHGEKVKEASQGILDQAQIIDIREYSDEEILQILQKEKIVQ